MNNRPELNRRTFLKTNAALGVGALGGLTGFGDGLNAWAGGGLADADPTTRAEAAAPKFVAAKPVWAKGREKEMNVTLGFFADFDAPKKEGVALRATGSTIGRVTLNGEFVGYGPARGPRGWFRVDEWNLTPYLKEKGNFLCVEICGYNCNSYYLLDQPSFLQAEVVDEENNVLVSTGATDGKQRPSFLQMEVVDEENNGYVSTETFDDKKQFQALDFTGIRVQKVQRFSFQRPFIEVYDQTKADDFKTVALALQPEVRYLPRRVPYPEFAILEPTAWGKTGKVSRRETLENPWRDRSLVNIGPQLKGYKLDELEVVLSDEIQRLETTFTDAAEPKKNGCEFKEGDVQIVDFGANYCGFFGLDGESTDGAKIVLTFDEILTENGDVNFLRLGTCSAIQATINSGGFRFDAFEPQVGRYAKIHCLEGSFKLNKIYLREYAYPAIRDATFSCADKRLDKIFQAAILTFRENSVDAFTDCPHRERAGWLCDSFFTARSAFDLTGKTDVEEVFFENYLLPEKFEFLPDGMLPMCYPADHNDGVYIPNWAMWFVAQLREFSRRSRDWSTLEGLRTKIHALFEFFEKYENSDGLLEKLPSWVFVEWSAANNFTQDVNYPSNMCYAFVLDAAGELYDVPEWREKAAKIRAKIVEQSFDGEFFVDHAVRKEDGTLEILRDRSEVCQYFAFFFKAATPKTHPELWKTLLDQFGPNRVKEGGYPEIHKANSFVGNVLRLELLATANRGDQLLEESVAYNEYMADRTGTLWENDTDYASCNHGFASQISHLFYRNVLGIAAVDVALTPGQGKITIRLPKIDRLDWASGVLPLADGAIKLRWEKKNDKIVYALETPKNYDVTFENASGLKAVKA